MLTPRILAPVLLLALAGCGTMASAPPPLEAANAVTRSTEQGGRFIALVGPHRPFAPAFLGVPNTNFYALRSWIDTRSGEHLTQLYVEDSYVGAQRNFTAVEAEGQALKFVPISNDEITCAPSCSYAEEFGAELPEALLRAHPQGLTVAFTAKSGPPLTIAVPGELIEKQLAALDAARPPAPSAAVPPPPK